MGRVIGKNSRVPVMPGRFGVEIQNEKKFESIQKESPQRPGTRFSISLSELGIERKEQGN